MKTLHNLEIHLAHGCNLGCESCSHYSNQRLAGIVSLRLADEWMKEWNRRLDPKKFTLLGGEPALHPDLPEFFALSRRNWPRAELEIVSNGFLLQRHPELPAVMQGDANASINISIHHDSPEYRERLVPVVAMLVRWRKKFGIRFELRPSHTYWTRRYRGFAATMQPYEDGKPRASWEICPAKYCRQLFDGKIWKCSPITYLELVNATHGLSEKWHPYLRYQPLAPECSDGELATFLDREEEPICAMCPAARERFALPTPLR